MGISRKTADYYRENLRDFSVKIPWRYFKYLLRRAYGFEMFPAGKTSGSKRLFHNGDVKFTAKEPHGKGDDYVDKTSRLNAIKAIERIELFE